MKKKISYKQEQKKVKALKIIKWVCVGLGWTSLLTCLILLLSLGVKGCNKKQTSQSAAISEVKTQEVTEINKGEPTTHNFVNVGDINTGDNWTSTHNNEATRRIANFIGVSETSDTWASYTWQRGVNDSPRFDDISGPLFINGYGDSFDLGEVTVTHRNGTVTTETFDEIYLYGDSGSVTTSYQMVFNYDHEPVVTLDQRDFDQADLYDSIEVDFNFYTYAQLIGTGSGDTNIAFQVYAYGNIGSLHFGGGLQNSLGIDNVFSSFFNRQIHRVEGGGSGESGGNGSFLTGLFSLISRVFEAIVPFFSVSIIPGITIGMCIALPLLLVIVLFVVKLFKR